MWTYVACQLLRFKHIQMNRLGMSLKEQWQTHLKSQVVRAASMPLPPAAQLSTSQSWLLHTWIFL